MTTTISWLKQVCFALIPIGGVLWILAVPQRLGLQVVTEEMVVVMLGLGMVCAFLHHPYGEKPGLFDLLLGLIGFAVWSWVAYNYEPWLVDLGNRPPSKWIPGAIGILLLLEALRKSSGPTITILVAAGLVYAFFGHHLPGLMEATYNPPTKTIVANYSQTGVPGLVLQIVSTIVLAFIVFGRLMEVSGATRFFTDLAMGGMGHQRGGPAKVAVVASSAFGMVSGSIIGNIMSTGIVTIPLMKQTGFKARYAAAIEAVSSNGGQIAPPIMGATAFLIAEFLEVTYAEVVAAAAVPAILYYVVLFMQVDSIARREKLKGLPKSELPSMWKTILAGWVYLIPIAVLLYFLFGLGFNPALSAVYATASLFVLMILERRRLPSMKELHDFVIGSGENLLAILLIGGAAGIVIGIMDSTGLGFQLSLVLELIGNNYGLFWMLVVTALVSIVLGMGMPTAAVYIVLQIVLAPAMASMGVVPMAAHLFLFYFGLLSMLTPPVAVASYVAAGLAGSNMWATGMIGMRLAFAAYLLPFLWIYNPALLLVGTWEEIAIVVASAVVGAYLLAMAGEFVGRSVRETGVSVIYFALSIFVGGSTVWFGSTSLIAIAVTAMAAVLLVIRRVAVAKSGESAPAL